MAQQAAERDEIERHADDVADTAHDYSKIINAKGTGDWLSTTLGVSGNTAAVAASHVLAFAFVKLKQAVAKRRGRQASESGTGRRGWVRGEDYKPLPPAEKAKRVVEVLDAILPALGCRRTTCPPRPRSSGGSGSTATASRPRRPRGPPVARKNWRHKKRKIRAAKPAAADRPKLPEFRICGTGAPVAIRAEAAGEDGKPKLPTFTGNAYTGAPMRPEGWYRPVVVDLAGVRVPSQHRPILRQHDHNRIVGHSTEV
jgi:hypothetical protein